MTKKLTAEEVTALAAEDCSVLDALTKLGGCYVREGSGPLVGYAGTYDARGKRHYVGELYANFAVAEQRPRIMDGWAKRMRRPLNDHLRSIDVFLGAPEGGKSFADKLALNSGARYVYPSVKKIPQEGNDRPVKQFYWDRHKLEPGEQVAIVEDVANNFSTTNKLIELVHASDCTAIALVCLLNRSPDVENAYEGPYGQLPVIAMQHKALPEYRQDDPYVADDVAKGNVVWKPKDEWPRLLEVMKGAAS